MSRNGSALIVAPKHDPVTETLCETSKEVRRRLIAHGLTVHVFAERDAVSTVVYNYFLSARKTLPSIDYVLICGHCDDTGMAVVGSDATPVIDITQLRVIRGVVFATCCLMSENLAIKLTSKQDGVAAMFGFVPRLWVVLPQHQLAMAHAMFHESIISAIDWTVMRGAKPVVAAQQARATWLTNADKLAAEDFLVAVAFRLNAKSFNVWQCGKRIL